jgi:hypothetical protein
VLLRKLLLLGSASLLALSLSHLIYHYLLFGEQLHRLFTF